MDLEKIFIRPQPYSQPLRTVARILAERESDDAAVAQLLVFLERSGIPVKEGPETPQE
ncbi:hypothetical protein [Dysosmobacter sp.]|uniref:hypothetical protein n=1 Tax=Dysosmobacter sp. TaxID=2591382 RepID=UPI003A8CAE41